MFPLKANVTPNMLNIDNFDQKKNLLIISPHETSYLSTTLRPTYLACYDYLSFYPSCLMLYASGKAGQARRNYRFKNINSNAIRQG